MTKEQITATIKTNMLEIMPELEGEDISIHTALHDLGLNSIDKSELIVFTLDSLELEGEVRNFATANNIDALANAMYQHGGY